jgi:Cytochrome domain of cellobiose dehydrogenase
LQGGNFKLQAIYDSATSATNFTLTSPATNGDFGWVGIGTGQQMAGSNMVISWVINNAVVTSNRHAVAEAMPQTTGLTIAGIERNDALTKSDTATGTTVSWIQPGFPAAGSDMTAVNMIWSHNPVAPTSNDPTTTLYKHEIRGFITFDLTKPYDATGNVAASATSSGQATGNRMMNKYNMIVFAHMVSALLAQVAYKQKH